MNSYKLQFIVLQFGDSQQLRMVRILRSTLMVRVGGGWTALDEFLVKNDPCRGANSQCSSLFSCKKQKRNNFYDIMTFFQHLTYYFIILCHTFRKFPLKFLLCPPTVKGRTNLKIKEKYLSPGGSTSKGLTVSRSNSSLSLYSSASAPTSPMTRKVRKLLSVNSIKEIFEFRSFMASVSTRTVKTLHYT